MAEKLSSYTPTTRRGPKEKYPWSRWLDGSIRRLFQGPKKDFNCLLGSMADNFRKQATARGLKSSVHPEPDRKAIVVRAWGHKTKPATGRKKKKARAPKKRSRKPQ